MLCMPAWIWKYPSAACRVWSLHAGVGRGGRSAGPQSAGAAQVFGPPLVGISLSPHDLSDLFQSW